MQIENQIAKCRGSEAYERKSAPTLINIHRLDPSHPSIAAASEDLHAVAKFFEAKKPGGLRMLPYGFGVTKTGKLQQGLPLSRWYYDSKGHSRRAYAVAVFGDFREKPPGDTQHHALIRLCTWLVQYNAVRHGIVPEIVGHTDLPNATNYPGHVCPGNALNVSKLSEEVFRRMQNALLINTGLSA